MNEPILLDKYPAEIVSFVAQRTLAKISAMNNQGLLSIGWYLKDDNGRIYVNPAIDKLYELTSAGVWIARTNPSGQLEEANSADIKGSSQYALQMLNSNIHPTVAGISLSPSTATSFYAQRRLGILHLTLDGAGEVVATAIHTGPAGYYPVIEIKKIISDFTDAATTLTFASATGTLVGKPQNILNFVEHVMNTQLDGLVLYNLTDTSAITVAVTGGGAAGEIWIQYEYWSET